MKGVSLVLANSEKAVAMLPSMNMELRERTLEEAKKTNCSLSKAFDMPAVREVFWKDYHRMPFEDIVETYMKPEKVKWQTKVMEHYPNTDNLILLIRILELPQRIINKVMKVLGIKYKL